MNAIKKEITPSTLANDIGLMRANGDMPFLLLEGSSDVLLFKKFLTDGCEVMACHGRENLIEVLEKLMDRALDGAIGLADKDYADYVGFPDHPDTVIFTDDNDMEVSMISSPAVEAVLREYGNEDEAENECLTQGSSVANLIYTWAAPLGAIRLDSHRNDLALVFQNMRYHFVSNNSPELCLKASIKSIVQKSGADNVNFLDEIAQRVAKDLGESPHKKLCQGHDCVRILARALRNKFGKNSSFDNKKSFGELGKSLRLAYEYEYFQKTQIFVSIRDWERETGYSILR